MMIFQKFPTFCIKSEFPAQTHITALKIVIGGPEWETILKSLKNRYKIVKNRYKIVKNR